jgi:2-hydroxychromene-2-carboxylate isomerase
MATASIATVRFHLDFISPYTWLALAQSERFAAEHRIAWEPHPVVYAALLDAHGLVGPVETEAKRRYTLFDVARCADRLGLRLTGPPAHPFRSLAALRALCVFLHEPGAMRLAVLLSDAAWGEGRDLTDLAVIRDVAAAAGFPTDGLDERIAAPEIKETLRRLTDDAVRAGVFGVPTFVHRGEIFWGHDRLDALAERLDGAAPPSGDLVRTLVERPRGAERTRRP